MNIENPIKNVLLTGGRAPVTLDLARKLHSCAITVYVAESLPDHLCKYSRAVEESFRLAAPKLFPDRYIEELKTIIASQKIDLVIPTCEEVFYISRCKEDLTSTHPGVTVFVDSFEKLRMLHDKGAFIEYVRRLGKVVPRTWVVTSSDEITGLYTRSLPERFVVKPAYSRFAAKVVELKHGNNIPPLDVSKEHPWVVQEFIVGKQYCSYSICHSGIVAAHTTYAANFTAGRGACICFEHTNHSGIYQWVQDIVKDLEFTGQIAFDFIETPEGILYPLECNPRATSGIHLLNARELVGAIAAPVTTILPSESTPKMISTAMLLHGISQCKDYASWRNWLKTFWRSQDVVFALHDPLPFFQQFMMLKVFYIICRSNGTSMLEATTHDIEWNGEAI